MTPPQFIAKWQRASSSERTACQQHFLDLCELLGQPKPAEADPDGRLVHLRERRRHDRGRPGLGRRLDARPFRLGIQGQAHATSRRPTSNSCSTARPWKTRRCWSSATWTASRSIPTSPARPSRSTPSIWPGWPSGANLDILRRVFTDPESLKPGITSEAITVEAAKRFARTGRRHAAEGHRAAAGRPLPR